MCGMSEPRMLNAQAIESLSVSTTASWPSALSRFWMSAILSAAARPASFTGCTTTGETGARRPVASPQTIDEVAGDGLELDAFGLERSAETLDLADRVQPRVVADGRTAAQMLDEPLGDARARKLRHLESGRIHLGARLHRVAAVDEQRRRFLGDDREARRAREPRDPLEALGARRHVLALMLVGARYQEGVEVRAHQERTELLDALGSGAALGGGLEGLEHAFSLGG